MGTSPTTFHDVYERHAEDLYRFAVWMTGDPAEAQDIVSETFVRVWTAPGEVRLPSVKGYLFAIARNLHRKRARKSARFSPLAEEESAEIPDPGTMPDQAAANAEDLRRVQTALEQLPETDRRLLLLRAQDGLPYEAIAAITGLSVATAKVRVFRARARLAQELQTERITRKET